MRTTLLILAGLLVAACGPQPLVATWTDHVPSPPPEAYEVQAVDPNGSGTFPISPRGAVVGVAYRYDMPHCGIRSPIDVDGSYWDAVGEPEGSVRFDGRTGVFRLVSATEATFTSDDGQLLRLVRHDGAKSFPGCD